MTLVFFRPRLKTRGHVPLDSIALFEMPKHRRKYYQLVLLTPLFAKTGLFITIPVSNEDNYPS